MAYISGTLGFTSSFQKIRDVLYLFLFPYLLLCLSFISKRSVIIPVTTLKLSMSLFLYTFSLFLRSLWPDKRSWLVPPYVYSRETCQIGSGRQYGVMEYCFLVITTCSGDIYVCIFMTSTHHWVTISPIYYMETPFAQWPGWNNFVKLGRSMAVPSSAASLQMKTEECRAIRYGLRLLHTSSVTWGCFATFIWLPIRIVDAEMLDSQLSLGVPIFSWQKRRYRTIAIVFVLAVHVNNTLVNI